MRIVSISLENEKCRPALRCDLLAPGLNVFFGRPDSVRTTTADLIVHALYGKRLAASQDGREVEGELIVDSGGRGFRLRRHVDGAGQARLTIAALDGAPVDRDTVRGFLAGMSPELLRPIYAPRFGQSLPDGELLSEDLWSELAVTDSGEKEPATAGRRVELTDPICTLAAEVDRNDHADPARPLTQLIDDARRQLTAVQRQLDLAAQVLSEHGDIEGQTMDHELPSVSGRLACLTDGRLVGIQFSGGGDGMRVRSREGQLLPPEWLTPAGCNQVRLSLCLALASACERRGAQLPLVFDEPFAHLEPADVTAMAKMLNDESRRGQQMLVFTGERATAERFAALGVAVRRLHAAEMPPTSQAAGDLAAA